MRESSNYSQFPKYASLIEAAQMHKRIEGVSESGNYKIQNFSQEAITVGVEELGFSEIIQSKLYLCAKMEMSPKESMEMIDKLDEENIESVATQTHRQLM